MMLKRFFFFMLVLLSFFASSAQNKVYFWGIPLGISQDEFAGKLIQRGCTYNTDEKCFRGVYFNDTVDIYVLGTAKSHKVYNVGVYYTQYNSTVDTASDFIKQMAPTNDYYMEILGDYIYKDSFLMGYFLRRGGRLVPYNDQIRKFEQRKGKLTRDFGTPKDVSYQYDRDEVVSCYKWGHENSNRHVYLAILRIFANSQKSIEYTAIRLDIIDNALLNLHKYESNQ